VVLVSLDCHRRYQGWKGRVLPQGWPKTLMIAFVGPRAL